jgi:hypothetical protein
VAGKVKDDNSSIQDVIELFEQAGYQISHDWTRAKGIQKPYLEYLESSRSAAEDMRDGVSLCEVFVLLCEGDIYGAMAEFGMAVAAPIPEFFGQRRIYVVGPSQEIRQSIFFALPEVKVCGSVDEVLADLDK